MTPSFHDGTLVAYVPPTVIMPHVRRPNSISPPARQPEKGIRRMRTISRSIWTGEIDFFRYTSNPKCEWVFVPICRAEGERDWLGGLKVWLRRGKENEEELKTEGGRDNTVEANRKMENRSGKGKGESTERKELKEVETEDGRGTKGGFRWPWQRDWAGDGDTKVGEIDVEGERKKDGKPVVRKLSHSDSKPGGVFVEEGSRSSRESEHAKRKSEPWHERWKGVMNVVVPNFKKKEVKREGTRERTEESRIGESGNGKIHDEVGNNQSRSSGVRELYQPPTKMEVDNEKDMREQRKSQWPQMPWNKENKDDVEENPVLRQRKGQRPSSRPRISRVPDVTGTESKLETNQEDEEPKDVDGCKDDNKSSIEEPKKSSRDGKEKSSLSEEQRREGLVSMLASTKTPPQIINPPEIISIPQRDVAAIRLIFGSETFFATETLSPPGGLIFRGNLRGEPKTTLAKLEERLAARLGDKYTLCLAQGEEDLRPVVVIVPTARDTRPATPWQRFMAFSVAVLTVTTIMTRGLYATLYKPIISTYYPFKGTSAIDRFFVVPGGIVFITCIAITIVILVSQLVQRVVASRHRTRIGLPYFIPSFQLGSFGAVVQLASPTPSRAALFDIALSGAATLVVLSLGVLLVGLRLSTSFPLVTPVPLSTVTNSLLIGFLTIQVPNGQILIDYGRSLIGLHPLAVIGANCLTIAALNLLPIRQLDGGRIISALYGRRTAVRASRVTVLFLLLASTKNPYYVVFLAAVTFGPWSIDRPSKNELTEPNGLRTIVGYLFMLLMISVLLPYPASKFYRTL